MAEGQVLRGGGGLPLYGKDGTLLYASPVSMSVSIVISWEGGKDVDIYAKFDAVDGAVGYSHCENGATISSNGFSIHWSGDNTSGGPETVDIAYSGSRSSLADVHFEIHANWYSVGTDAEGNEMSGGGAATITATDSSGNVKSFTLMPGTSKGRAANAGDPGARLNFNSNGTLKSITAW